MKCDLIGVVKKIGEVQEFPSGFSKRIVVITENEGKYPQSIPIEFCKDNIAQLDDMNVGDSVKVEFFLSGNEWKDKDFLSANGWKISVDSAGGADAPDSATSDDNVAVEYDDDIPY